MRTGWRGHPIFYRPGEALDGRFTLLKAVTKKVRFFPKKSIADSRLHGKID
jgi:hypothetical protein